MTKDQYGRELHPIKCDRCGADDTVPFVPIKDRKVFCKTCLKDVRKESHFFVENDKINNFFRKD